MSHDKKDKSKCKFEISNYTQTVMMQHDKLAALETEIMVIEDQILALINSFEDSTNGLMKDIGIDYSGTLEKLASANDAFDSQIKLLNEQGVALKLQYEEAVASYGQVANERVHILDKCLEKNE